MTPKKVYYYDYHTTLDTKPQEIKVVPETPVVPVTPATPPPPTPASYPVTPSFLPTLLIVILVSAIIYLAYSLIPKNYPECTSFPGSKISSIYPGVCTTFYGQSFSREIEAPSALIQEPEYANESNESIDNSDQIATDSGLQDENTPPTTKGGLPLTTPTPTPKNPQKSPTPISQTTTGTNDGSSSHPLDWIKHRYPTQKIAFYLPPRFTSTNVTRNLDTQISKFTIYDGNRSVIQVTLQKDWQNTQNAQNQSLTFMLSDNTGVIKLVSDNHFNYYFTHQNLIYIFSCTIDSTTCDTVVKSLEFI